MKAIQIITKYRWWVLAGILIIIIAMIAQPCTPKKDKPTLVDTIPAQKVDPDLKKREDSLVNALKDAKATIEQGKKEFDAIMKVAENEKVRATFFKREWESAKKSKDTARQLAIMDSIVNVNDSLANAITMLQEYTIEMHQNYDHALQASDSMAIFQTRRGERAEQFASDMRTTANKFIQENNELRLENYKLNKQVRRGQGTTKVALGALALKLGYDGVKALTK